MTATAMADDGEAEKSTDNTLGRYRNPLASINLNTRKAAYWVFRDKILVFIIQSMETWF